VSLRDGSELWRVGTGEEGVTYGHALAVTAESVLVGEYDVVAFDRVTGRRQWTFVPRTGYAPDVPGDVHAVTSPSRARPQVTSMRSTSERGGWHGQRWWIAMKRAPSTGRASTAAR